ncbi:MAG: sigma-54-dependent Fis family transcriptional regulator [Spirochaetes bacterium]|nr:sigma-54-dependent Fis family transcriptional regulator [Spirochaetota bacterium]
MGNTILVVDDNVGLCKSLARNFGRFGYKCLTATTKQEAVETYRNNSIDVVLLDIVLGEYNGLDLLDTLKDIDEDVTVIMITGYASIESAVKSIKIGAYDYIQKPFDFNKLLKITENALEFSNSTTDRKSPDEDGGMGAPSIVTSNPVIIELCEKAKKLADTDLPILICGENGTGKEIFADYIHSNSSRRAMKMLKINCAAFPENLLDNELFGHEKGSYTGADMEFKGVFERADKSSLFLDEIGDMSFAIQAKILRVLQNNEIRRIGGDKTVSIDVRFIAASNKNLEELITKRRFREDLYYRLNAVTFSLPPLRERRDDIPLLAKFFLKHFSNNSHVKSLDEEVLNVFKAYEWPGNIRQLKNTINYAAAIATKDSITTEDLPPLFLEVKRSNDDLNLREITEKSIITRTLCNNNYNKKKTAEMLRMSRRTLYNKIEKYGIPIPQ